MESSGFTFKAINQNILISFQSRLSGISLAKGDSIIMLFEDQNKIEFVFQSRAAGQKQYYHNSCPLKVEHAKLFLEKKFLKLKITSARQNTYSIFSIDYDINNEKSFTGKSLELIINAFKPLYGNIFEGQYLLRLMMLRFVKEFVNYNSNSELSIMKL